MPIDNWPPSNSQTVSSNFVSPVAADHTADVAPTTADILAADSPLDIFRDEQTTAERLAGMDEGQQYIPWGGTIKFFQAEPVDDVPIQSRQGEIDTWVAENAEEESGATWTDWNGDNEGGENVAAAYNGDSSLGELTDNEVRYLATQSLDVWIASGNNEAIRESVIAIEDPETATLVAAAYAAPAARTTQLDLTHGRYDTAEANSARAEALKQAIGLDAAAVIDTFEGLEGELGRQIGGMPGYTGRRLQQQLLQAVADQKVDVSNDGVSQMVTAIFLQSGSADYNNVEYRTTMSRALAVIMVDRSQFTGIHDSIYFDHLNQVANRFDGLLSSQGGRQLLVNDKIVPELRGWAVVQVANNSDWTAANIGNGWESRIVSETFAEPILDLYLGRGTEPQVLTGEALRNSIGQALGIPPDLLPPENETAEQAQARLDAGFNYAYYGPNARIDDIFGQIEGLGIENPEITIMPVVVTSNDFGAANFNVFRVENTVDPSKPFLIEDVDPGRLYKGVGDWRDHSQLPPGKMTYARDLDWNGGDFEIKHESTALVTDSIGEWFRKIGDGVALVVGVAAGVALVVGTGGTGALFLAGGAGFYATGRAAENLHEAHTHGEDITDLSDPKIRANWIDAAAGILSFGAMGVTSRAVRLATTGSRYTRVTSSGAAFLQLTANGADALAATNQGVDLADNWDQLDNGQRAMGLLNIAFWGGMTAGSTRAGGGTLGDSYSFTRLRNNIEFGTPYNLSQNLDLQPGQMRVVYDLSNGRASNISIEYGGSSLPDPAAVSLHSNAARQIEFSGGLLDTLNNTLRGNSRPPVGSEAWEAQIEIGKIDAESRDIVALLNDPNLSKAERDALAIRQIELRDASIEQQERLTRFEESTDSDGIYSPSRGSTLALARGWPEAPEGHVWVAGIGGEPHLRIVDGSGDKLYYDPVTRTFSESAGQPESVRVGHGDNDVSWFSDAEGNTVRVRATLRAFFTHSPRTSAELSEQGRVGANGLEADHGGHIIGHRFLSGAGLRNLFAQDGNFNTGAYKTFENEVADWIAVGADVTLDIQLNNHVDGRPAEIVIEYTVIDPSNNRVIHEDTVMFDNEAGQSYDRISSSEINSEWNKPHE